MPTLRRTWSCWGNSTHKNILLYIQTRNSTNFRRSKIRRNSIHSAGNTSTDTPPDTWRRQDTPPRRNTMHSLYQNTKWLPQCANIHWRISARDDAPRAPITLLPPSLPVIPRGRGKDYPDSMICRRGCRMTLYIHNCRIEIAPLAEGWCTPGWRLLAISSSRKNLLKLVPASFKKKAG